MSLFREQRDIDRDRHEEQSACVVVSGKMFQQGSYDVEGRESHGQAFHHLSSLQ